jgi:hypothetical protein
VPARRPLLRGREAILQSSDAAPEAEEWTGIDDLYLADG